MADEKMKEEDLEVVHVQADGSAIVGAQPEKKPAEDDDTRLSSSGTDDEQHEDDAAVEGETAEEAEARRLRNRERRAHNKGRRKDYIESLKRELSARDELLSQAMQRLDAVERRGQSTDIAAIDNELKKTADAYNYFKTQIELGTKEQNGAVVADATEKMIQAQRRYEQLTTYKKSAATQQQAPQTLDPRLKANAEEWLSRNTWYDLEGRDEDSFLVKSIDARLSQEGYNPTTKAYWDELDARVKKYLPHRAVSGYNRGTQANPKSPVAGSGRDSGAAKGGSSYALSPERVQALKDSGVWDDPKERAKMIKRYQDYDKQHAA